MIGRFPFFVLNLSLAPQEVDVNVHPTKAEVRFADDNRVFTSVSAAAKLALSATEKHIESALDNVQPKQPPIQSDPLPIGSLNPTDIPRVNFRDYAKKGASQNCGTQRRSET